MTLNEVKKAVVAVLADVQARQKLPCPTLKDTDVPPKVLDKFDSTVWPAATTLIARKLGVKIPHNVHVFAPQKGGGYLPIQQIAELIMKKHEPKTAMLAAA